MRLLLTRPERDAERTAAVLRACGHTVTVAPLLGVQVIPDADIGSGPWAAILITSANAAPAVARHRRLAELRQSRVFAVGERSAAAARMAGFAEVVSADGNVADLARLVAERVGPGETLLYLAGAQRSGDLAGVLHERGFVVRTIVVYRAVAALGLPHDAMEALKGGIDGVLHFSRRSAEIYASAVHTAALGDNALKGLIHFCLSAQVAEPLAQAGAADVRVAPEPVEAALLALIP